MSVQQGCGERGTPTWAGMPMDGTRGGVVVHNHFLFKIEGNAVTMDKLARDVEKAFLQRGPPFPYSWPA
ncbi:hypothetical protein [Streptomyces sp. NPDC001401]|uniref:hypothetical protein n=1 Tax=Streptomyces sp. NPDC001401 TaxID=3364570 RepID=UPI00369627B4